MSENTMRDESRAAMLKACEDWIAEFHEDGIITGWITIMEVALPNGRGVISWATGDGMPTRNDEGWIQEHRFRGMIDQVRSDLNAREVVRQLKEEEE